MAQAETTKKPVKNKGGRPAKIIEPEVFDLRPPRCEDKSDFREEMIAVAATAAKYGATDAEIAEDLGVCVRTYYRYRAAHPKLAAAVDAAKDGPNKRVERSLFKCAIGYTLRKEKLFNQGGKIIRTEYEEEVGPNFTACLAWLNNRDPDRWRQNRDARGGNDGANPTVNINARVVIEGRMAAMAKVIHGGQAPPALDEEQEQTRVVLETLKQLLPAPPKKETSDAGRESPFEK